ncbi:hypothetical protein LTR56_016848 [Elasticomyces elasticus]|nr:hypothetical protein LTR56_016848 [Elasticomyces elasticus]KAK3666666.1 hypothetical protein LTR22_002615 [Elasticomyces elasticus]KAK4921641.1 hypothetical protein LTR49_010927 [Elasticomyces elasticus]KAK5758585.1 hypothetical protein LTS12_011284 [Elasticomyces elasticus]
MNTFELVRLAKLDAIVSEDLQYTRHTYSVAKTGHRAVTKEAVWKRTAKPLGAGGFGEVYREECIEGESAGELRAVKSILKPTSERARKVNYANELHTVARFSQPEYEQHFVKSFGWYETNEAVLIAMEFVELGDLQSYLRSPFSERDTAQIILQVLRGLTCMHAAGYAHRDLKPANLLVFSSGPRWHVKIADFGLSKRVLSDLTALRTNAGTQGFMAPEMLGLGFGEDDSSDEDTERAYTDAVDIWAVGVIAHLLLTGEMPFSPSEPRALGRYARGKTPFPIQALTANRVGQEAQTMIKSLMASRPSERPTSDVSTKHIWLCMNVPSCMDAPSEGFGTVSDVPSAQWTVESQDSGYHGQETLPTVVTQNLNTPQRPEDRTKRSAFTNPEEASTLVNPEIAPRTRAIPMQVSELPAMTGQHQGAREVKLGASMRRVVHTGRGNYWKSYKITKLNFRTDMRVGFSGDGQLMACTSQGKRGGFTVWDVATSEQPILITSLDDSSACALRFSHNGQRFVFVYKRTIMVYSLMKPSRPVRIDSIELASTGQIALRLSPDGQLLAYVKEGNGLRLRNLSQTSGDRTLEMPMYRERKLVNFVFSPDGRLICAGSMFSFDSKGVPNVELLVWDAASCQLLVTNVFHTPSSASSTGFCSLAFSSDGKLVAFDHGIGTTLVSVATLQITKTLERPASCTWVYSLAFIPDDRLMAVMRPSGRFRGKSATVTWDLSTHTSVVCPLEVEYNLQNATISSDGMKIATVTSSSMTFWRLKEHE